MAPAVPPTRPARRLLSVRVGSAAAVPLLAVMDAYDRHGAGGFVDADQHPAVTATAGSADRRGDNNRQGLART